MECLEETVIKVQTQVRVKAFFLVSGFSLLLLTSLSEAFCFNSRFFCAMIKKRTYPSKVHFDFASGKIYHTCCTS